MEARWSAGGLASGLDTNSMIEGLVKIESRPLDVIALRQRAARSQLSVLGDLISRLQALDEATRTLSTAGVLGIKASTNAIGYSATASSSAVPGTYGIQVTRLAVAARAQSQTFSSADAQVTGGTLTLGVDGTNHEISITNGASLSSVAAAINASTAPVSAVVLEGTNGAVLSVTRRQTGHVVGQLPASALTITQTLVNGKRLGQPLNLSVVQPAANATFKIDGVAFERSTNRVTDALDGVTLDLKTVTSAAETLTLAEDSDATAEALEKYVTAYNEVARLLQQNLATDTSTNREANVAGIGAVRSVQRQLQALAATQVTSGSASIRSLADIGIKTQRDGTLTLDKSALAAAVGRDPEAVNKLFSDASTGIATRISTLAGAWTAPDTGVLIHARDGINDRIEDLDAQKERLELRIEQFRENLVRQFAAMEELVSGLRSISDFLARQAAPKSGG